MKLFKTLKNALLDRGKRTIVEPISGMVDDVIASEATSIGSFAIRYIKGKFQRSIILNIDNVRHVWMEEALYQILGKYNDIKNSYIVEGVSAAKSSNDRDFSFRLPAGQMHNLNYRGFKIMMHIAEYSSETSSAYGSRFKRKTYTIVTWNLSDKFIKMFEADMIKYRNSLNYVNPHNTTIKCYTDYHETDGYTGLTSRGEFNKRSKNTLYLPKEVKDKLFNTVSDFLISKEFYHKNGIPWNLKIVLHGLPGTGKSTISKVIASEFNRRYINVTGGKNGRFIPNTIKDISGMPEIVDPLIVISDIDKYPAVINDTKINLDDKDQSEKAYDNKQIFGNMLNALDGTDTGEGKIIIMDTNHIEKFSPTFLRAGRIDLVLEIPPVNEESFRDYIKSMYNKDLPTKFKLKKEKGKEITIPQLQFDFMFSKLTYEDMCKKYIG